VTSVLDVLAARFAVADPGANAVSCGGDGVSWNELDRWSWAVAARLTGSGVGVGDVVPVLGARGGALAAGWLGALRSGAAYAPLGLDTPSHRLGHILAELGAGTVLSDRDGAALLAGVDVPAEVVRIDGLRTVPGRPPADPVRLTGAEPAVVIYTSGTTGRPKGVLVPHRGMLNTVLWWADDVGLSPADRLLCTWSTSFDGATHEVFRALVAGSELIFADDVERRDPRALGRLLRGARGATVTSMTPSLLRAVLDADVGGPTTLRTLYVGGEALPRQLAEACRLRWGVPLRNIYGPTEASCISTYAPVAPGGGQQPAIGVPVPNTRAYVLGPHQEELPTGAPGELYVAGVGVALGYVGPPERSDTAFPPDPYADEPGARMYRTGDRVVRRADGLLEHLGRVDDQVKILGNRIEPGEVRRLLEEQPAVRSAAVHAVGEPRRLVAYVELAGDDPSVVPTRDEVVRPLLRWLPGAVLPADVFAVDAVPMTGNDKVDFAALGAMPSRRLPDAETRRVAPAGDELRAAELFVAILREAGRDPAELGPDANFFTVGGHSLLAVRMLGEAERRGAGHLSLRDFLADPTVAGLGRLLAAGPVAAGETGAAAEDRFPATPVQQRFWFLDRVGALRSAYLAPVVVELTGAVDGAALRGAVESVLGRHPALRSRFELDRTLRRVYYRTDGPAPAVTRTDASGWDAAELRAHVAAACWTPFDLAGEAPARADVVSTGDRTLLVLVAHHIVTDGWSQHLLLAQIGAVYGARLRGVTAELAEPVHPERVAAGPRDALDGRVAATLARLRGAPTDVGLPHDRGRTAVQPVAAARRSTRLGAGLTGRLRASTGELGCTTFMLTAALLAVTLARRGAQRDYLFAFPWAGRDAPGTADAVGMFVTTLVLRVDLTGDPTWREILTRVRAESIASYRHADVPFEAVAAALHPDRDLSRPPVTPVYVSALDHAPAPPALVPTASSRYLPLDPLYVKYELELTATDHPDDLELAVSYAVALFDADTVAGLLDALVACAADLATDPHTHPLEGI
jgi:amino acid adenylation domain-containing protein